MTPPNNTSDNKSPSMEDIHLGPLPENPLAPYLRLSTPHSEQAQDQIEEHIKLEDCDATLNTEPMEGVTNGKYDRRKASLDVKEIMSSWTFQENTFLMKKCKTTPLFPIEKTILWCLPV
jgi:hypothetical protein